ncbi:hypothetical protein GCM10010390_62050 [Streptomyces mordarskii]|uniref:Secreted protein n=1 Tax=Streptomyces mordarskii TaxID=1226758 RepID=A0ABP3NRD4_9ACTN
MPSHLLVLIDWVHIDWVLVGVVSADLVLVGLWLCWSVCGGADRSRAVGLCESVWWVWCESVCVQGCGRKPTLPLPGPQAKGIDALLSSGTQGV